MVWRGEVRFGSFFLVLNDEALNLFIFLTCQY